MGVDMVPWRVVALAVAPSSLSSLVAVVVVVVASTLGVAAPTPHAECGSLPSRVLDSSSTLVHSLVELARSVPLPTVLWQVAFRFVLVS